MPIAPADEDPDLHSDARRPSMMAGSGSRVIAGVAPFWAGQRIAENLELVRLLGVGGMGDVWLANHLGLDTLVAVKFMSAALAQNDALIERFAREAKLASRIKSPHVVQIFDFAATPEGIPYIVMELIDGETMEARILRETRLGLDETSRILVQLCRGLGKAHEVGIIHRDMKPDNVLLGEEEGELFVKILDFGIAKNLASMHGATDAGAMMGTPPYMSPEQLFRPAEVDHRSDLWALGVMTYRCLTGRLPFEGDTLGAVCVAVNEGSYPPASRLNREIPRSIDEWVSRALAMSPSDRFRTAREMSDAYLMVFERDGHLPHWAAHKEPAEGMPPTFAGGTGGVSTQTASTRQAHRRRRHAASLFVGGALLVGAGFWSRDPSVDRFLRAQVPSGWASRLGALRDTLVTDRASAPSPSPVEMASATPAPSSPAIVSLVLPAAAGPAAKATQVVSPPSAASGSVVPASARPGRPPAPSSWEPAAPTPALDVVALPKLESEDNPYSGADAESPASASE
jgi:serine/threonine-protein kinase